MANRMMHLKWVFDTKNWLENVGTGFQNMNPIPLSEMLAADPVSRKAAVSAAVTTFLKVNSKYMTPPVPTDPVKAGGAWPSPRSWTNVISVLSQLDRYDEEAAFLVVEGLVGEAAATEYFKWLAAADLHDPAEVIDGTVQVDWKNERADRLFALVQGVTALGLSGDAELWRKAAIVLAKCAEGGKPDVAFPSAQKLANNMPKGVSGLPKRFADAFMELFGNTKYKVAVAA
jgi:hypothetical protein